MWYLLGEVGDRGSSIETTQAIGLVVAKTRLDPVKAVHALRALFKDRPWEFKYTLKLVPIQQVVPAQIPEIENAAVNVSKGIAPNEKFRITIEKRHTHLSSKPIIDIVAKKIDRTVNLDAPDKILLIEIIDELAGLSLLTPNDTMSVEREKRADKQKA